MRGRQVRAGRSALESRTFGVTGDGEDHEAGTGDGLERERHALVGIPLAGIGGPDGEGAGGSIEGGGAGEERGGVAVRSEPQVDEVEHGMVLEQSLVGGDVVTTHGVERGDGDHLVEEGPVHEPLVRVGWSAATHLSSPIRTSTDPQSTISGGVFRELLVTALCGGSAGEDEGEERVGTCLARPRPPCPQRRRPRPRRRAPSPGADPCSATRGSFRRGPWSSKLAPLPQVRSSRWSASRVPSSPRVAREGDPFLAPGLEERVDDAPGPGHLVGADEQGGVSDHCVVEEAFVGVHVRPRKTHT